MEINSSSSQTSEPQPQEKRGRLLTLDNATLLRDKGYAYSLALPPIAPQGDTDSDPYGSQVRLFEDGAELGPRHIPHAEIRKLGKGRFSHWDNALWFSTSDNSSPVKNGRSYQLYIPETMYAEGDRTVALLKDGLDFTSMPKLQRFNLARKLFLSVWPHSRLPDIGRRVDTDSEFAADFARVCPEADFSYERKYNLDQLFKLAARVEGDVAECGAYKGASAFFLARHILRNRLNKKLCLFDSFEGLSSPSQKDGDWWRKGDLRSSADDLRTTLSPLGDLPFVEIYKGWIPKRFPEVSDRRFCFAHIDVDLLKPTSDSMEFFYPRLVKGGMILLDDYGHESCPGVTEVVNQYMVDKPEPIINIASGGAFIIKE